MEIDNALQQEFDDFLDEEYGDIAPFESMTADSANYYVRRVKKNNETKKKYEETAKELKARAKEKIELWLAKRLEQLDNDTTYCTQLLQNYFNDTGTDPKEKIRLSEGCIGMYKQRDAVKFPKESEEELLTFLTVNAQEEGPLGEYIKTTYSPDTTALRKNGKIVEVEDENGIVQTCLSVDGIVLPAELVSVSIGRPAFAVK